MFNVRKSKQTKSICSVAAFYCKCVTTFQGWPKNPNPKKTAQKNPKKPSQKNPQKTVFLGFFENSPKIIQKKAKNPIKPNKTP